MKKIIMLIVLPTCLMASGKKSQGASSTFSDGFWRTFATQASKEFQQLYPDKKDLSSDKILEEIQSQARAESLRLYNAYSNQKTATIKTKLNDILVENYLKATQEPVEENPQAALAQKIEILKKIADNIVRTPSMNGENKKRFVTKPYPNPKASPQKAG